MTNYRQLVRSWGIFNIRKKKDGKKETGKYPCDKHIHIIRFMGWLNFFVIIFMLIIILSFKLLMEYAETAHTSMIDDQTKGLYNMVLATKTNLDAQITIELNEKAREIKDDIKANLDLDELDEQLSAGIIPTELEDIFEKHLDNYTAIPGLDPEENNVVVCNYDGVVSDFSHISTIGLGDKDRTWNNEQLRKTNPALFDNSIKALLNQDTRYFYMIQTPCPDGTCELSYPAYMTEQIMQKIYYESGIEGLKHYVVLVPSYIEKDRDMFGTRDIINGKRQPNNKIILIQKYNLYDFVQQRSLYEKYNLDIDQLMTRLETLMHIGAVIIIIGLLSIVVILASGMNYIIKDDNNCSVLNNILTDMSASPTQSEGDRYY